MHEISIGLSEFSCEPTPEKNQSNAFCLAQWLYAFWIPTQRRKHESVEFVMDFENNELQIKSCEILADWKIAVKKELKKIIVEDLGDLDATELGGSIPEEDPKGRGMADLHLMQKDLHVKVIFHENRHVYLVGPKAKLDKKCFTLRNMLSHYHWRMSGKDHVM